MVAFYAKHIENLLDNQNKGRIVNFLILTAALFLISSTVFAAKCPIRPELHTVDTKNFMTYINKLPKKFNVGPCKISIEALVHCTEQGGEFDTASYFFYLNVIKNGKEHIFNIGFNPDRANYPYLNYKFDTEDTVIADKKLLTAINVQPSVDLGDETLPEYKFSLMMDKDFVGRVDHLTIRSQQLVESSYEDLNRLTCP